MELADKKGIKEIEITLRRLEVERLHILGNSITEIAKELNVDVRTINRDIQENRREKLKKLIDGTPSDFKDWLRDQLADYMASMDEAKRVFHKQAQTFKTEPSRIKALWYAVQIENQKIETIKSLMLSIHDLRKGGNELYKSRFEDENL